MATGPQHKYAIVWNNDPANLSYGYFTDFHYAETFGRSDEGCEGEHMALSVAAADTLIRKWNRNAERYKASYRYRLCTDVENILR